MASFFSLVFCSLLFLSPSQAVKTSFHPHALLLPVQKDSSTLLYTAQLNQTIHQVPQNLTLDLGGQFLWVDCERRYSSATHPHARCRKNGRGVFPENTVISVATSGKLCSDVVLIPSTNGYNLGSNVSVPHFLFVCGPRFLLKGLPSGVKGMAGLGRTKISLPSQFSSRFGLNKTFAICLSSGSGVVFFGPGPYFFPYQDVSFGLIYTPLLLNPITTAAAYSKPTPSSDYFFGVTSIRINQITVPNIDASLLAIDHHGNGGTKISTLIPYTVLQTSIYNAVMTLFQDQLPGVPTVAAVAPFGLCFNSTYIQGTRVGAAVPPIHLVLQNETVYWSFYGWNSMVQVSDEVLCFGFVDGGVSPRTSIVIGGHQLEDNLVQFDLGASRLGFSSNTLLAWRTSCSTFNSVPINA